MTDSRTCPSSDAFRIEWCAATHHSRGNAPLDEWDGDSE
jgi:hypothetical protein